MTTIAINAVSKHKLPKLVESLSESHQKWVAANGFAANLGEVLKVPNSDGQIDMVLFGLGDKTARERSRLIFGDLPKKLPEGRYHLVESEEYDAKQAQLAWELGKYSFDAYKSRPVNTATLKSKDPTATQIAEACALTQDLINQPANVMNPERLAKHAQQLADAHGAQCHVIIGDELLKQNFPLIHAVGRASDVEPRLIDMRWGKESDPKITLVGKGVCFDTGGLNIKPGNSMGLMKKDMGGAANVLGLAQMIMSAKLPISLRVLIPAVENSISANAFRPGDILTARDGKTIEINNTDAEGRLVLADALAYASEESPQQIISMATLTGAARVAVGPDLSPFFTTDDTYAEQLSQAAMKVEDPVWRLPFWAPYDSMIEPDIADLDNAPAGGFAGAITAALFLKRFIGETPYTHFDIYGWTPIAKPARAKGGAAQAIRAIFETLSKE